MRSSALEGLREELERVRESEGLFRRLFEEAPVGMVIYEESGAVRQLNRTFTELTGYTLEDIASVDDWLVLAYRERAAEMSRTVGNLRYHDDVFRSELPIWTKDSQQRTFLVSSISLGKLGQETRLRLSSFVDISTEKQAGMEREGLLAALAEERARLQSLNETLELRVEERTQILERTNEALLEARDRFFTMFHASPIPTVLTHLEDGTLIDANTAYLRYFGFEREEVVGKTTTELDIYADPGMRRQLLRLVEKSGHADNVEIRLRDKAGEERTALASAEVVPVDGLPGLLISFVDVTERIKAERKVRLLASELTLAEQRERRRIAQVLHDDIQQMLIAHQINLQLLSRQLEGDIAASVHEASDYVLEIVDVTRTLSRELSPQALKNEHLRDAFVWLSYHMEEHYRLQVDLQADGLFTLPQADLRELVVQLVRELLFNVVKHAGVSRVQLKVEDEPEHIIIHVIDQGRGFDVDEALKRSFTKGSMGLFSVQERIGLFGGSLKVQSEPGKGTYLKLTVPKEAAIA